MLEQRIQQLFIESADLKYKSGPVISKAILSATQALVSCLNNNGKVIACGAGPSAPMAALFESYFIGGFQRPRPSLAALALAGDADDPLADTAQAANPEGFARMVNSLGQHGDVLLAISTTGESASLLAAIRAAHDRDMIVVALLGQNAGAIGRALRETDIQITAPHELPARIREVHLLTLHCLCDGVDDQLLGEQEGLNEDS